jgi:outer membrane protein
MNKHSGVILPVAFLCIFCTRTVSASESGNPDPQPGSRTLTIQEAVRMSLAHAPEVLLAQAQAVRAREAVRESRSLNRPQLVAGTGLAYNNGFPLSIEGAAPSIFQIGLSQSLFSKKNNNLIREAEETGKASQLGTDATRNELASRTALVYLELFQARRMVPLAMARLDAARAQQEIVEIQFSAGRVRPVDVTASRAITSSARQRLLEVQEQARLAEVELRELTGLSDIDSVNTVEPIIESSAFSLEGEALFQDILARHPEILQAEANIRSKELHLEAEKGGGWPQFEFISQYALFSKTNNYDEYFNRFVRNNFLVGLSIQVPIFTGSRTSARVAQSRQEVAEARYQLQRGKSNLKIAIQRGLSALRVAAGALDAVRGEVALARESNQVSRELLETGRISAKEMEELRSQLRQKEMAQMEAEQVLLQKKVELLRIVGTVASTLQ